MDFFVTFPAAAGALAEPLGPRREAMWVAKKGFKRTQFDFFVSEILGLALTRRFASATAAGLVSARRDPPIAPELSTLALYTPAGDPVVPEPSTWAMMLLGFAGLGYAGYRSRRARLDSLA